MKNRLFKLVLLIAFFCMSLYIPANAIVASEYDIRNKIYQMQDLASFDLNQFVNKSDLIGYRKSNFNMLTSQYSMSANLAIEQFNNILSQIQLVQNSSELSDSDKRMHLTNLYIDADKILYDLDSKTINFLYSCKNIMPTITYQRFVKKFLAYYNSLQITNAPLNFH